MAYTRKTADEFEVQGYYNGGWEMVTTEVTRKEARENLRAYRENESNTAFKIVKKRVPVEN